MERAERTAKARIVTIQRMSTEDGPGIRTTVFFKGCGLKCRWCHNPECLSPYPEIQWIGTRCIGCRACIEGCPEQALTLDDGAMHIQRAACSRCGLCAYNCPSTAMERIGRSWEIDDLFNELIKDRAYFDAASGGITVSGGEPGLQAPFVAVLLQRLRAAGLHTALDTCGFYPRRRLEKLLPHSALVLFDLKEIDPERHRAFTGQDNRRVLENAKYLSHYLRSNEAPPALWIRTPIIPLATDRPETIRAIGRFIAEHFSGKIERWELCAFNNLCKDKYQRLDRTWEYADTELLSKERMQALAGVAKQSGVDPCIVFATGRTRLSSNG
jgi:pyruvate formate lyase activating enzyme